MPNEVQDYTALREQVHEALAAQHPEWVEVGGESPIIEAYDARFAELLRMIQSHADPQPSEPPDRKEDTSSSTRGSPRRKNRITDCLKRT